MITNVKYEVKENKLVIEVDLTQDYGPSKSGKTHIVASTGGAIGVNGVQVNLNVYK